MPIYESVVRREKGAIVVDIPLTVQPIRRRVPGKRARYIETKKPVQFITGILQKDGRIRIITHPAVLGRLDIDPYKRIALQVGPYWIPSHLYHGVPSGGVFVPRRIVEEIKIKPNDFYSGRIAGITISAEPIEVGEITIDHLEKSYTVYERKWYLPVTTATIKGIDVNPEDIFGRAVNEGKTVARWYYDTPGFAEVEFVTYPGQPEQERFLAYSNNLAFRIMGVKNYVISAQYEEASGKVLEESRATILVAYPRNRIFMRTPTKMTDALNITARNMGAGLFYAKKWNKKGEQVIGVKLLEVGETAETIGNEWNRPIDFAKAREGKFQYVEKYARFQKDNKKPWIGLNSDVEELMDADERGLIWRKTRNTDKR